MKLRFVAIFLGLTSLPSFGHEVSERFCHEIAISEESICRVSHFQLAAHPDEFDGKLVVFSSVLRKIPNGPLRLYYSNEAADYEMADDVIVISEESIDTAKAEVLADGLVRVYGRFHARESGRREAGIGAIEPVLEIFNELRPKMAPRKIQSDSK